MTTRLQDRRDGLRATYPLGSTCWAGRHSPELIAGGLVLMMAIAIGTGLAVERFRQDAIENGREGLESAVLLLAQHFDRQFEDFSVLQKEQRLSFATLAMFLGQNCIFALHTRRNLAQSSKGPGPADRTFLSPVGRSAKMPAALFIPGIPLRCCNMKTATMLLWFALRPNAIRWYALWSWSA